jgi:4-hydroxy-2-oxoheptanedioate aldolase
MKTGDPAFVEVAGYAGFDFVILDREHGPSDVENLQNLIRAAIVAGVVPVVRVPGISEEAIGKALDVGAGGIQIPQISTAEQAREAVKLAKFFPLGERGVCRFVRAARYSAMDRKAYFEEANKSLVILQLEGTEAVNNVDEIMGVQGVDIIFIGPYDLSQSLGIPGEVSHPLVVEKMKYIVKKAEQYGTVLGTFIDTYENAKLWKDAGIKYLSWSVDVGIFLNACQGIVEKLGVL